MTKLHCDLSDAVNVLCHMQPKPGAPPVVVRCGRGARWATPGSVAAVALVMCQCQPSVSYRKNFIERTLVSFPQPWPLQLQRLLGHVHLRLSSV